MLRFTGRAASGQGFQQLADGNSHGGEVADEGGVQWREPLRHRLDAALPAPHCVVLLLDLRQQEEGLVRGDQQPAGPSLHQPIDERRRREAGEDLGFLADVAGGDYPIGLARSAAFVGARIEEGPVLLHELLKVDGGNGGEARTQRGSPERMATSLRVQG